MNKIFSNSLFSIFDQLLSLLSSLGLSIVFARYLGAESLGQYTLALSITGLVAIFSNFGINTIVNREVAKSCYKANLYIGHSILIKVFVSAPVMLAVTFSVIVMLSFEIKTSIIIMLAAFLSVFNNLMVSLTSSLTSLHRNDIVFKINAMYKIITVSLAVILIYFGFEIKSIVVSFIVISILMCYYSFSQVKKVLKGLRLGINYKFSRTLILMSLPLIMASAAEFVSLKVDTVFIGYFYDEETVGFYSAAYNIFIGATLIPLALTKVYFPNFVSLSRSNFSDATSLFYKYLMIYVLYASLSAFFIYVFSSEIIQLVYGHGFGHSSLVLKYLSIAIFVLVLNRLFNYTLLALKFNKYYFNITFFGMVINVFLNVILIPIYGVIAAVVSTIVTESFVMLFGALKIKRIFKRGIVGI